MANGIANRSLSLAKASKRQEKDFVIRKHYHILDIRNKMSTITSQKCKSDVRPSYTNWNGISCKPRFHDWCPSPPSIIESVSCLTNHPPKYMVMPWFGWNWTSRARNRERSIWADQSKPSTTSDKLEKLGPAQSCSIAWISSPGHQFPYPPIFFLRIYFLPFFPNKNPGEKTKRHQNLQVNSKLAKLLQNWQSEYASMISWLQT